MTTNLAAQIDALKAQVESKPTTTVATVTPIVQAVVVAETPEQEIARLRAENAKLMAKRDSVSSQGLNMKVSEKGAVSIYGLGRFPVTLYREQWTRLLAPEMVKSIGEFIASKASKLSTKPTK